MSMICPNSCPASTGVVLGNDPPHPGFYAVSAKFAKLQLELEPEIHGGKSGVSSPFWWEIRCQFTILARKDEPTPDYAEKMNRHRITRTKR